MRGSNPRADCSAYQFSKLTPSPTWVTFLLSEWRELNPRPVVYKTTALTNWATFQYSGDGRNWTSDFLDMNQVFSHWTTSPWWFWKDLNPLSEVRSFMCSPLHHKTNCCPPRIRTSILWTKTRCTAVIREDNLVGVIGLEPMNSNEGGFTVRSNCRYATLPNKLNQHPDSFRALGTRIIHSVLVLHDWMGSNHRHLLLENSALPTELQTCILRSV